MKTFKDLFGCELSDHTKRNMEMVEAWAKEDLETMEGGLKSAAQNLEEAVDVAKKATEAIMESLKIALNNIKKLQDHNMLSNMD